PRMTGRHNATPFVPNASTIRSRPSSPGAGPPSLRRPGIADQRKTLDGGEAPLRGAVGGNAIGLVHRAEHVRSRQLLPLRLHVFPTVVALEFIPGARGQIVATKLHGRIGGEARMALAQVAAIRTA